MVGLHIPVPGVSSRTVLPSENTAQLLWSMGRAESRSYQFSCIGKPKNVTGMPSLFCSVLLDARPDTAAFSAVLRVPSSENNEEGKRMLIPTVEVKINPGRRTANADHIRELAKSISEIGLLNPITVDHRHVLIAGLHRLEAAKLLNWPEIECTVSSLEGLQAELAEIDENFIRNDLSPVEYGDLLLRRKAIYESLYPEARNGGDR